MKKLALAFVLFMSALAHSQVSVNVNIGTPPNWGPVGYDDSRYYYLPDIDIYYDVTESQYIYFNNGVWIRERRVPARYRNYDFYSGYKVVLRDYRGSKPYSYHSKHRVSYKPQKHRGPKPEKNYKSEGKQKSNGHNNGNGKGKGNSKNEQNHSHGNGKH
ncbi:hypothetical protein [Flavobacterium pectinovorum]|uniref:hypothetical protein n=1 Tax=Flavobacterium pectinovorum TaxID=29533 RepID=UPI001FAB3862|nr:hypothetical protein [Flavobacterium pectinovorum]MCI9846064.1 hypothetical protein [Flavobacterium pectinovorum]